MHVITQRTGYQDAGGIEGTGRINVKLNTTPTPNPNSEYNPNPNPNFCVFFYNWSGLLMS